MKRKVSFLGRIFTLLLRIKVYKKKNLISSFWYEMILFSKAICLCFLVSSLSWLQPPIKLFLIVAFSPLLSSRPFCLKKKKATLVCLLAYSWRKSGDIHRRQRQQHGKLSLQFSQSPQYRSLIWPSSISWCCKIIWRTQSLHWQGIQTCTALSSYSHCSNKKCYLANKNQA